MLYILGKLSAPGSQKSSHFLHRVKWRNAMYHNEIDTPCLSCNSEQMKIKAKFFHLGTWCHWFLWFETQSTVKKEVFINVEMRKTIVHFSRKIVYSKIVWFDTPYEVQSSLVSTFDFINFRLIFDLKLDIQQKILHGTILTSLFYWDHFFSLWE